MLYHLHYFSIFNALWQINNNTEFCTESEILTFNFFSSNWHSKSFQPFFFFVMRYASSNSPSTLWLSIGKWKKAILRFFFLFFLSSFSLSIKVKCNADGTIWTLLAYHSDPKFSKNLKIGIEKFRCDLRNEDNYLFWKKHWF